MTHTQERARLRGYDFVREHFHQRGVPFREVNIQQNPDAEAFVIFINGAGSPLVGLWRIRKEKACLAAADLGDESLNVSDDSIARLVRAYPLLSPNIES